MADPADAADVPDPRGDVRPAGAQRGTGKCTPFWTGLAGVCAARATLHSAQGRKDDTPETVRERLPVYAEQTEPLVRVYGERVLLVEVVGMGSSDEVTARLLAAVGR